VGDLEVLAEANRCIGWFCLQLGYADEGIFAANEARNYYANSKDDWGNALTLAVYSWLLVELGLADLSYDSAAQAVVIAAQTNDNALNAFALSCKAISLIISSEYALALPMFEEALALARLSGDPSTIALTLVNLGYALMVKSTAVRTISGDEEAHEIALRAIAVNDEAIAVARSSGDFWNLQIALCNNAEAVGDLGFVDRASVYLREADGLPMDLGPRGKIHYLYTLGDLHKHLREYEKAQELYLAAMKLAEESAPFDHKINTLRRLSDIKAELGNFEEALNYHRAFHAAFVAQSGEMARRRAHAMDMQAQNEKLREAAAKLEVQAGLDALTGVPNRRAFDAAFAEIGQGLAVVGILDVDHFKLVNDRYSHLVGDKVLQEVASAIESVGQGMEVYRIGGEEFALVFPGMALHGAEPIAKLVLEKIRALQFDEVEPKLRVTVSIGLAEAGILHGTKLLAEADRRLYVAKKAGRDRVIADDRSSFMEVMA
jgi:diguanylate cyclase (GGDEF)-like protein